MKEEQQEPMLAPRGRVEVGGVGAGEASASGIARRAHELAHTEGRDAVTDSDRARAREELSGPVHAAAPEAVNPELEQLVEWDAPPDAFGHRVEAVGVESDESIGEQLVQEGLEEADHQQRVSAVDDQDRADRLE